MDSMMRAIPAKARKFCVQMRNSAIDLLERYLEFFEKYGETYDWE